MLLNLEDPLMEDHTLHYAIPFLQLNLWYNKLRSAIATVLMTCSDDANSQQFL